MSFLLRTVALLWDRSESAFCAVVQCGETHALSSRAATAAIHRAEPSKLAGRYSWATILPKQAAILELPRDIMRVALGFRVRVRWAALATSSRQNRQEVRGLRFHGFSFPAKAIKLHCGAQQASSIDDIIANVWNPTHRDGVASGHYSLLLKP
jgi:hypothetical protein